MSSVSVGVCGGGVGGGDGVGDRGVDGGGGDGGGLTMLWYVFAGSGGGVKLGLDINGVFMFEIGGPTNS
jgi:hypothetical protein